MGGFLNGARVEVWRGSVIESVHRGNVAVVDAAGRVRARSGDAELVSYARSALKPIQALVLVEACVPEAFGWGVAELALCCGSHSGERRHVELAASMLRSLGLEEGALACGPHAPMNEAAANELRRAGREPRRLHNNCSGKHAGMLGLARVQGWPTSGYERAGHPVQQRMLGAVAAWTGLPADEISTAVDGCGVVTYALPLRSLAGAYARLGAAARGGQAGPRRIVQAMASRPDLIAGTDRLCTALVRVTDGRICAKVGAEGVYAAAVVGAELGVALKIEDGAQRAAEPLLLAVLRELGVMSADEYGSLGRWAEPAVKNTRGEEVGRVRTVVGLEACDA